MKKCIKCGLEKNVINFSQRKSSKDGLHTYCKECVSKIMKIYGDRIEVKERAKEWKKANKEKIKEHAKRSYEKNKIKRLEKIRKYNEINREKINLRQRKYNEKNRDIINQKQREFLSSEMGKTRSRKYYHKIKKLFDQKIKARNKLRYAVKTGKIMKSLTCEICKEQRKLHGHHSDYTKPLEVMWVCDLCHKNIHSKLGD